MSSPLTVNLNGLDIEVAAGATLREAAESQGVRIPTFCHDDRLKPFASCFLCVVEVEGSRGLLPACSTRVAAGMVIRTDSERVTESRRTALDLLLSDHAGDCVAPCEAACPANIDVQGYVAHIANGDFAAAVRLIKERNPLPVVCGRICPHPCESQCRRGLVDEPVAINPLKRFASEFDLEHGPSPARPGPDSGQRVAIVGGGPAGLSAAHFLRLKGHQVHIFEALPELGGMTRYGIPRFRLPWALMDREIQAILDLGVAVHCNRRLGRDFTLDDLKRDGFGAILIAIGAHRAKPLRIRNEQVPGVIGGVDFLRRVVLQQQVDTGQRVAVIGGGDTAMDCARVARRLGAEATLLYRRSRAEMPALPIEQEETLEEGVELRVLTAPVEVLVADGRAVGLKVLGMELGDPDESARRRPVPIPGSEEELPFDLVIAAIGQDPDLSCLDGEATRPETTRWHTVSYDARSLMTSVAGVFAAGDCAFGPDIVIRAVAEGRRAADAIDLYLKGAPMALTRPYAISRGRLEELEMADYAPRFVHQKRALESTHPAPQRLTAERGWAPINVGLDRQQAIAEAGRCIECGCNARFDCALRRYATVYDASESRLAGARRDCEVDDRHPLVAIEADKCITCGSCVRVCGELREVHALTFIDRGFATRIGPNFNDPLQQTGCDACGMCIDVCPTGAIRAAHGKESGPWDATPVISSCTACSRGCGLAVRVAEGRVVDIRSIDGDPVNGAAICAEGRFGHRLLDDGSPAAGDPADLEQARRWLADASGVAVVVAPRSTVEESYAAARLARACGGTLHYLRDPGGAAPARPCGKLHGEANVALLNRLGARVGLPTEPPELVVQVNTDLPAAELGGARSILVGSDGSSVPGALSIATAGPLAGDGALLNRDGDLALLHRALPAGELPTGYHVLAALAGEPALSDLATLRGKLISEVPELAALRAANGARLVRSGLAPELTTVAPDRRERSFALRMQQIGLGWELSGSPHAHV